MLLPCTDNKEMELQRRGNHICNRIPKPKFIANERELLQEVRRERPKLFRAVVRSSVLR